MLLFSALVVASLAFTNAQVTSIIAPKSSAPASCSPSNNGQFEIAVVAPPSTKRKSIVKRDPLILNLSKGILKDKLGRTGYIASNYQFQFDGPPQTGAIYTAGFSLCSNGTLALGGSTLFYQCLSGNFYNLYDRWWAAQCQPIELLSQPVGGAAAVASPTNSAPIASGVSGVSGASGSSGSSGSSGLSTSPKSPAVSGASTSFGLSSSPSPVSTSSSAILPKVTGPTPASPPLSTTQAPKPNGGNRVGRSSEVVEGVAIAVGLAALVLA